MNTQVLCWCLLAMCVQVSRARARTEATTLDTAEDHKGLYDFLDVQTLNGAPRPREGPVPLAAPAPATFTVLPVHIARTFPVPVHVAVPVAFPFVQQQELAELLHHLRQLNGRSVPTSPPSPPPTHQSGHLHSHQLQHLFQLYS